MIYGYVRVSTDKQDCENQKLGVLEKARQLNVTVEKWIEDNGVSGMKEPSERKLGGLLKKVKKNDMIIIPELSRFGRSTYMVMRILEVLSKEEVLVYSMKDNFCLDNSITSKMQAFVFSIAAEIERDMISRRTKEALERKRKEGVVLGRPVGSVSKKKKLSGYESKIVEYLEKGLSYTSIARLINVHRLTVAKMVEDSGLTKYRRNYRAYSERKQKAAESKSLKFKNQQKQMEFNLLNDEIVRLYIENNLSLTRLAAKMEISAYRCRKLIIQRGLWDRIKEVNERQRKEVKSSYQVERETGIPRREQKSIC
ncbi:MAG: recombinase family protein [Tannerella sp.]|jgi:DNA invertase Pin-like site-specific DNA recombinase|nr:recombinase family protein [Tannerella sp.]